MIRYWISICFSVLLLSSYCQVTTVDSLNPNAYYKYPLPFPEKNRNNNIDSSGFVNTRLFQPIIGIGPGILTFYGDVSDKKFLSSSLGRIGYNLSVSEYISRSFLISAHALFGTVAANENGPRFISFESNIRSGGVQLSYNFDNFLSRKRRISPFILSGFEYFGFLSKADMFDGAGAQYFYWSDGSIKNMDENDPNASSAIALTRDHTFETDIRKANIKVFGKYSEHSFAVPVGAGVNFHLAPRWNFKLGATMHFTLTDYIDGVTSENKGKGKGDSKKDNFLETYFTLTFDLFNPKPPYISSLPDAEFLAIANEDTDGDGVIDFKDSCAGTPPGVTVDAKGCPADSDGDGLFDYADKEPNSPPGAFIDKDGIGMDDSTIALNYRIWSDSTGQYAKWDTIVGEVAYAAGGWDKKRDATTVYRKELTILVGKYKEGVPPSELGKLLSVPDVKNILQPDSTTAYTAGSYGSKTIAEKRRDELIAAGFPNAKVMIQNKNGSLSEVTADGLAGINEKSGGYTDPVDIKGVVFRVQLGAYSKKLSTSVFSNVGKLVEMKTEDGLYKYTSGSSSNIQDAIKNRDELVKRGYKGAFVVAYKDGKRVQLSSVSGGIIQKPESMDEPKTPMSAVDKSLVSFRLQVGAFVNDPPADVIANLKKVPGLDTKKKSNGVTQYLAGKFNSYEEAKKFRDELTAKYGISDAFIIAFFKEDPISVLEAVELLK